jgi:hypothetical protein
MKLLIELIGYGLILLGLIHVIFPKAFDWKSELASLSLINRQLMTVHTFFVAFTVFLMGVLCISSAHELLTTSLGKKICIGLAIFWGMRLFTQLFWYSPLLWKGKPLETSIHILFLFMWSSITIIFGIVACS